MAVDTVEITSRILEFVPEEAEITRVEYEGPKIAIYAKNPDVLTFHGYILTETANKLKKRVIARSEPSARLSTGDAKKKIEDILGPHSEVAYTFFDSVTGEVVVYVKDLIDSDLVPQLSHKIVKETKWFPELKKYFAPFSQVLRKMYSIYSETEEERRKFLLKLGDRIFREPLRPSENVRLTALGGAREVGRSCFALSTTESKVLVDCGVKPGAKHRTDGFPRIDYEGFDIEELDAVVLTHAHLDHSGLIPFLYKHGYQGPLYLTEPTLPLIILLHDDFIQVAKREGNRPPYTSTDIRNMVSHAVPLKYGQVTDISPDVKLTFYNAGHILGSASAHFHITEGIHNVVFTGDFKYSSSYLLDKARNDFTRAETLVTESTYGGEDDTTPSREQASQHLRRIAKKTLERGGKVLIPVPAVGRAQEILLILDKFIKEGGIPEVPVFIDGMIDESTSIHVSYPEYLGSNLRNQIENEDVNPLQSEHFVVIESRDARSNAVENGPSIIVSTSGMMEGGPVLEHFRYIAPDSKSVVVFPSYQVPGTLGRRVIDGKRTINLTRGDKLVTIDVNCKTERIEGFSGHSNRKELVSYLKATSRLVNNYYMVHGEPDKCLDLARTARRMFRVKTYPLNNLQTVPLT